MSIKNAVILHVTIEWRMRSGDSEVGVRKLSAITQAADEEAKVATVVMGLVQEREGTELHCLDTSGERQDSGFWLKQPVVGGVQRISSGYSEFNCLSNSG